MEATIDVTKLTTSQRIALQATDNSLAQARAGLEQLQARVAELMKLRADILAEAGLTPDGSPLKGGS